MQLSSTLRPEMARRSVGAALSSRKVEVTVAYAPWPTMGEPAWHGIAGEYARKADRHTEADPVGVLVSLLAGVGAVIGRGPHILAGNDRHPAAVWPVLVGDTSKGAKGTAWAVARAALKHAAPDFFGDGPESRVRGGYGSGEALVDEIRDPDEDDDGDHPDPGAFDKRLLVTEREYARMLQVAQRDGSTLSMLVREGWDGHRLETRARKRKVTASDYHLVIVGHITGDELRAALPASEAFSGWANRFAFFNVRRCGRLPDGGNVPDDLSRRYGDSLGRIIEKASSLGLMARTEGGRDRWAAVYEALGDDDPPGILGAAVARAEPMTARLSLLYALLDGSDAIDVPHVEAAYAVWRYARQTAQRVWGGALGDVHADRLEAALVKNGGRLTGDEQYKVLGTHVKAPELARVRDLLVSSGRARVEREKSNGRPREVLVLCEKSEKGEKSGLPSLDSLSSPDGDGGFQSSAGRGRD